MTDTSSSFEASVSSAIVTPDSAIRSAPLYQCYVRLARPTLDWVTTGAVAWVLILQPVITGKMDLGATVATLAWAASVYGIKTYEKRTGIA